MNVKSHLISKENNLLAFYKAGLYMTAEFIDLTFRLQYAKSFSVFSHYFENLIQVARVRIPSNFITSNHIKNQPVRFN